MSDSTVSGGPRASIKFFYVSCSDLLAMRRFYSELLGLHEISFNDDEMGSWLAYQCDGFQFMIMPGETPVPVIEEWGVQPGWEGGTREGVSWSLEVPEANFAATVAKLAEAGAAAFAPKPGWQQDSYWSFPVRDPQGNTVEVFCTVKERPASTEWE
jgi:catechol 2,3-dioxygenase-like lactoylglutathione lyase family enzyme